MSSKLQPLRPALKKEEFGVFKIQPRFQQYFFEVYNNSDLFNLATLREQVWFVNEQLPNFCGKKKSMAAFFRFPNQNSIAYQLSTNGMPAEFAGRPPSYNKAHFTEVIHMIVERFNSDDPMRFVDALTQFRRYYPDFNEGTFRKMIDNCDEIKSYTAKPTDKMRFELCQDDVKTVFQRLNKIFCSGIHPALVMNVDESGFSEVSDSKEVQVLGPTQHQQGKK